MDTTALLIVGIALSPVIGLIWWLNSVLTKVEEDLLKSADFAPNKPEPRKAFKRIHQESS